MLDKYKESQPEFYDFSTKIVENNKISHAYFIETSSFVNGQDLVLSFAKFLLCKNHFVNNNCCNECNICSLIDTYSYKNLYVINPDGNWIKKEQILALKEEFSNKSLDDNYRIYIINQADKLNKSAANAMLKFLEEPEENIIGILVSDNRYNVINTLLSRCQIFKLKNKENLIDDNYGDMIDFAMNLERSGVETICYLNTLWHSKYQNKEDYYKNLNILEEIYLDSVKYDVGKDIKFIEYKDSIEYIVKNNSTIDILNKIEIINSFKEKLSFNLNNSLAMDKFIIDFVGGVNND